MAGNRSGRLRWTPPPAIAAWSLSKGGTWGQIIQERANSLPLHGAPLNEGSSDPSHVRSPAGAVGLLVPGFWEGLAALGSV